MGSGMTQSGGGPIPCRPGLSSSPSYRLPTQRWWRGGEEKRERAPSAGTSWAVPGPLSPSLGPTG